MIRRVVCRVRPENALERARSGGGAVKIVSATEVEVLAPSDAPGDASVAKDKAAPATAGRSQAAGGRRDSVAAAKKGKAAAAVGALDGSEEARSQGRRNASFTEGTSFAPVAAASGGVAAAAPALGLRQAHRFTFDRVLGPSSTQQECYDAAAAPVVATFLAGYNCTIFAYGQTASGKVDMCI
jgi:hypothetical protein